MGRGVLGNRVAFNISKSSAERMLWDQERRRLVSKARDPEEYEEDEDEEEQSISEQKRITPKTPYKKFFNCGFFVAVIAGFAVAAFCTYALVVVATSEPVESESTTSEMSNTEGSSLRHGSSCSGWSAFEHRLSELFPIRQWLTFLFSGHYVHPKKWHPCLSDPNSVDDFDAPADNTLASPFNPCMQMADVIKQAHASGKAYLIVPGWKEGYSLQQENVLRGLWLAKLTNSILLLPPFYTTHPRRNLLKRERMEKYFDIEYLITHVFCSTGIKVVPELPASLRASIGNQSENLEKLASNRYAASIPEGLLLSKDPEDTALKSWLGDMTARINSKEIRLFVYPFPLKVNFTTPEQMQLKKDGMGALRPSQPIREVSQKILLSLGKEYRQRIGGRDSMQFAALQLHMEASGNLMSADDVLVKLKQIIDPMKMVLYVASGPFSNRDIVLAQLGQAYSVANKDDFVAPLRRAFPENEILAAVDQWVLKEATLFIGYSDSAYARMVYQMRCFTYTIYGKLFRDSVFYDKGTFIIPCRVKPFAP